VLLLVLLLAACFLKLAQMAELRVLWQQRLPYEPEVALKQRLCWERQQQKAGYLPPH